MGKKFLLKKSVAVLLLVLLFAELAPAPYPLDKREYDLVIATIADLHVGWGDSTLIAAAIVRASQEADVIVFPGDLCEYHLGKLSEFFRVRDYLKLATVPALAVPGNHDEPIAFGVFVGPTQWVRDLGGYRLIGLNTRVRRVDFKFLKSALNTELPILIFAHHNTWLLPQEKEILTLLSEHRVLVWACGHHHFQWVREDPTTGTIFFQGGWGTLGTYQLICLKGGKVANIVLR